MMTFLIGGSFRYRSLGCAGATDTSHSPCDYYNPTARTLAGGDVRFGSLADIASRPRHVRYSRQSGHSSARFAHPFSVKRTSSLVSTTRHDQLSDQYLHHFVSLIAREASDSGDPAIRPGPRGYDFQDLAFDLQDVAGTGGPWPGELASGAYDAAG